MVTLKQVSVGQRRFWRRRCFAFTFLFLLSIVSSFRTESRYRNYLTDLSVLHRYPVENPLLEVGVAPILMGHITLPAFSSLFSSLFQVSFLLVFSFCMPGLGAEVGIKSERLCLTLHN